MSKEFKSKLHQIIINYPGVECAPAFLDGPMTKLLLSSLPQVWIHIFQKGKYLQLLYSRFDAEKTLGHKNAVNLLKGGELRFSFYDPSLQEVFNYLNAHFAEKHYENYSYDHFKTERNKENDEIFGEDLMDLVSKACCHFVSKHHFSNHINLILDSDFDDFGEELIEMIDEFSLLAEDLEGSVSQKITLLHNGLHGEEIVEITKNKVEETYNEFKFRFREKF